MASSHGHMTICVLLLFARLLQLAGSFSTGDLSASCPNQVPIHRVAFQPDDGGYSISTVQHFWQLGQPLNVTINCAATGFLGFMMSAYDATQMANPGALPSPTVGDPRIGTWPLPLPSEEDDGDPLQDQCAATVNGYPVNALTHANANFKCSSGQFHAIWDAPPSADTTQIWIYATIVRDFSTIYAINFVINGIVAPTPPPSINITAVWTNSVELHWSPPVSSGTYAVSSYQLQQSTFSNTPSWQPVIALPFVCPDCQAPNPLAALVPRFDHSRPHLFRIRAISTNTFRGQNVTLYSTWSDSFTINYLLLSDPCPS